MGTDVVHCMTRRSRVPRGWVPGGRSFSFSRRASGGGSSPAAATLGPGRRRRRVSSPAIEPATSGQRARSSAAAIAWAEPGSVFTTTSRPASRSSTGRSAQQLAEAVLAGRLGLDEARRQRVGLDPLAAGLHEPELGDVAADRRLGRPEAALAERRGQLLLRPDRALVDEVADRPLAELLHDLHGAAGLPLEEDDEDDRREHDPVGDEDVQSNASAGTAAGTAIARRPDTSAATMPAISGSHSTGDAEVAADQLGAPRRRRPRR